MSFSKPPFSQIPLNLWNESYENDFIAGQSNQFAIAVLLNSNEQVFLCGPKFCGKKHIAHKIAKQADCHIFITDLMSDAKIISQYDEQKIAAGKAIWIGSQINNVYVSDMRIYGRSVSADVASRLNSMQRAEIFELTEDMLFPLLNQRLESIGFIVRNEIINYCIQRIPRTYEAIEQIVAYIKKMNRVNLKEFREFANQVFG